MCGYRKLLRPFGQPAESAHAETFFGRLSRECFSCVSRASIAFELTRKFRSRFTFDVVRVERKITGRSRTGEFCFVRLLSRLTLQT